MEVLHVGLMLKCAPKGKPGGHQFGDVARLANGRLVARCRFDRDDGTTAYGCRDYDPHEKPETAPWCAAPTNWGRWIEAELNRYPGRYRGLAPRDYDRERAEVASFRHTWPHITARLAEVIDLAVLPAPVTLFDLGPVLWGNIGVSIADYDVDWRRLADQHTAGSFGVYGEYNDLPLTDDELWTLAEQPVLAANKVAIASKSGAVRSRFLLSGVAVHDGTKRVAGVDVVTVLSPRGPRTLMSTTYVDEPSTNGTDT